MAKGWPWQTDGLFSVSNHVPWADEISGIILWMRPANERQHHIHCNVISHWLVAHTKWSLRSWNHLCRTTVYYVFHSLIMNSHAFAKWKLIFHEINSTENVINYKQKKSNHSCAVFQIKASPSVRDWQVLRRNDNFFRISWLFHVYAGPYMLQDRQFFGLSLNTACVRQSNFYSVSPAWWMCDMVFVMPMY